MNRRKRVIKRGGRTTKAKGKPRDLHRPPVEIDPMLLERKTYLTVDEAMVYIGGFYTRNAFYCWLHDSKLPRCRVGRGLRFLRRDIDNLLQPPAQSGGTVKIHLHARGA